MVSRRLASSSIRMGAKGRGRPHEGPAGTQTTRLRETNAAERACGKPVSFFPLTAAAATPGQLKVSGAARAQHRPEDKARVAGALVKICGLYYTIH